jgi:hypothetical protein
MNCRALIVVVCLLGVFCASQAAAQATYQPTPPPTATAENLPWYQAGEPVIFNGSIYYPAGPQVHFQTYEMVRSGYYRGIQLYSKTTIEQYSIVFVPLAGGLMQPYERRRSGDLAGTVGSTAPSFPTTRSFETSPDYAPTLQAQAPPTLGSSAPPPPAEPVPVAMTAPAPPPTVVGTAGRAPARVRMETIPRPTGTNGIYIDFDGARWYSAGTALEFDPTTMKPVGQYRGFTVFAQGSGENSTIYVPVTSEAGSLVATYARKPR